MGILRRFLKKRVHFGWKRFRIDFDIGIRSLCFTKNEYFIRSSRFVIFDRDDRRMRVENGKDLYNPKDINEVQIDDYITIKATLYQDLACRYLDKFREKKRFLTIRQVTKMGGGDEDIVYMDVGTICLNLDKIAQGPMIVEGDIPFFSSDNSMAKGYIRAILRYRFVNYKPPKPRKVKKMPPPVRSRFERNREVYDAIANAISSKYGGFSIDEFDLDVLKNSSISSSTGEGDGGSGSSSIDAAGVAVIGAVAAAETRKGGNGNTSDTDTIANLDQLLSKFHLSDKEFGYSPSEGEESEAVEAGGGEGASGVVGKDKKQKEKRLSAVQRITQQLSFNSNKSGSSGGGIGAKSTEEEERRRNGKKKDKKTKKHTETKEETLNNYFNVTIANSSSTDRNERDNERGRERDEAEEEESVRKMGSKYLEPARKSHGKRSRRSSKGSRERKERHSSEREDRTPPGSSVERKPHRQESGESNHTFDSKTSSSTTRSKRTGEKDINKRKHSRRRSSASANSDSDIAGTAAQPSPGDNPADTVHISINNSNSSKSGNCSMRSSSNKTHQQQRLSSGHDRALEPLVEELDRSVLSDSRIEAPPPLTSTSSSASRGAKTATAGTAAATATINPRTAADEAAALLRHREQAQHTVGSAGTSLHSNGSAGDPQQPSESESGRGARGARGERGARGSGSYGVPVSSKLSAKVRENLINNTKDAPQNRWFDFDPVMNDHHNQQQEQQHYQQQFQPHQQLPRGEKAGEGVGGRVERTRHGRRSSAPDMHPPVHPVYTAQNELQHHLQQQGNIQTTARPHSMNHHQPPLFPSYSTTYSSAASFASPSASTAAAGDDRSSQQRGNYPTPQSPQWMDVNPQYGTVHASSTHNGRAGGGTREYSVPPYSLYGQVANNQQQQCHRPDHLHQHINHHQQEQQQQQRQTEREQLRSAQIGGQMKAQRPGLGRQSQHQSETLTRADSEEDMLDFGISNEDFVGVY